MSQATPVSTSAVTIIKTIMEKNKTSYSLRKCANVILGSFVAL